MKIENHYRPSDKQKFTLDLLDMQSHVFYFIRAPYIAKNLNMNEILLANLP